MEVGQKVADAAGEVIRKYFRQPFDIIDKPDLSGVLQMNALRLGCVLLCLRVEGKLFDKMLL